MKGFKLTLVIMAAAILTLGLSSVTYAFHSGGVAECEGCHTMHNSVDGSVAKGSSGKANTGSVGNAVSRFLLIGSDQGSTCLNCHQETADTVPSSYHIDTRDSQLTANGVPTEMTPGGDFGWLKIAFTWTGYSGSATETGDSHGHNIIASDYGYTQDGLYSAAPGGTYSASLLTCVSCHDPHTKNRYTDSNDTLATDGMPIGASGSYGQDPGNASTAPAGSATAVNLTGASVGVYRLLGGANYQPKSVALAGGPAFDATTNPPKAVVTSTYNQSEATNQVKVAYGSGMSEWCANCHTGFLNANPDTSSTHRHPAGLGATDATIFGATSGYNTYVNSGNIGGGSQASSYLSLVPYEEGPNLKRSDLKGRAGKSSATYAGPVATDNPQVMCLSCHRAHASGFPFMERFGVDAEMMTTLDGAGAVSYFATDAVAPANSAAKAMGRTKAQWTAAYYGRSATAFGGFQRALCNKCHAKG